MIPVERLTPEARSRWTSRRSPIDESVRQAVEEILRDFRKDGDGTIRRLAGKYDRADLDRLEVAPEEFAAAEKRLPQDVQSAILSMLEGVVRYHKTDVQRGFEIQPFRGVTLGKLMVPFERAGVYVPGGLAPYPSSVVMAAGPAGVAGVREIVLCTPPSEAGTIPDAVLFAARACGVARVFKAGGAQAIFAMAYGTRTVPRCEILVGPGNAYVTAAKRIVRDDVAIDFLAGPSEILVVSDGETSARSIAAELLAQAEHAPDACGVLVTTSERQAREVAREIQGQLAACERAGIIWKALSDRGALLVVSSLEEALEFANEFAPEHLTLSTLHPADVLKKVRCAGSVFLGEYSPVAMGDYGVGPNHILPTMGEARRRGGLTANTFLKSISYQRLSREGLETVAPPAMTLARVESLQAHLRSLEVRLGR